MRQKLITFRHTYFQYMYVRACGRRVACVSVRAYVCVRARACMIWNLYILYFNIFLLYFNIILLFNLLLFVIFYLLIYYVDLYDLFRYYLFYKQTILLVIKLFCNVCLNDNVIRFSFIIKFWEFMYILNWKGREKIDKIHYIYAMRI